MTKTAALHVIVSDFDDQLGPQRFPGKIFALAPAALAAWHPLSGFSRCRIVLGPLLPGVMGESILSIWRENFGEFEALFLRETRANADMLERAGIVDKDRAGGNRQRPSPFLCQRNPATTQSQSRSCLTLSMTRLFGS